MADDVDEDADWSNVAPTERLPDSPEPEEGGGEGVVVATVANPSDVNADVNAGEAGDGQKRAAVAGEYCRSVR